MNHHPLGRLLIVDDEVPLLNSLADKLSQQGYETTRLSSPTQALLELERQQFDLLLTDMMMPEMNGLELLKAAQERDPFLVGIVMTGQATVQSAIDALKTGAADYIMKPFKINVILPALARAIEMRRLRLENIQLRETVGIYELCNAISFTLDFPTLLNKIADAAMQQCEADEVSIMLASGNEDELRISVLRGPDRGHLLGERVSLKLGIAGWVARHRQSVSVSGAIADPRFAPIQPRPDIRAAISMPMQVGGKLIGVLNVSSTTRRYPYSMGQVKALAILANTGAAALESAQLHQDIRRAEEKYRSIFENASEGIMQSTPDGKIQIANPAVARMLGYESPESLITSVTDLGSQVYLHSEDRDRIIGLLDTNGVIQNAEVEMVRRDAHRIWISLNGNAVRDAQGKLLCFETTFEDISHRKQTEQRLAAEHRITRILAEATDVDAALAEIVQALGESLNWEWCAAWRIEETQHAMRLAAAWHRDSDRHQRFRFKSGSSSISRGLDLPGRVWATGTPVWIEELEKDGNFLRLESAADANFRSALVFPIVSGKRVLGAIELLCSDRRISDDRLSATMNAVGNLIGQFVERNHAEARLRDSEHRYRELVEAAPDMIFGLDADARFTSLNSAFERVLGWPPSQWINMPLTGLTHEEDLNHVKEIVGLIMQGKTPPVTELRLSTKSGKHVPVELTATPQGPPSSPTGALAIARDVSERRRLEEQVRRSQRMEAVGRLAGGVAHDFNNLLTVINGYCEILINGLVPIHEQPELVRQIHKAGDRAAGLTRQLLAFSRKQIMQTVKLNINQLVADMEKMLLRLIGEDIDLAAVLDPALGFVKADPGQIEQVVMNLVINARDAMPDGGHLTIETRNVELDEHYCQSHVSAQPGQHILLAVTDTGCGIDEETKSKIFEPFFTTKELGKGTGLGLSTVHGIVRQSGGHIEVYSEVGIGTSFKIYLSRLDDELPEVKSVQAKPKSTRGVETILLAEDDEDVRTLICLALESSGYTVIWAANGEAALKIAEQHHGSIDLLITDAVMPKMGGRELAERLVRLRPGLKILFLSGYTDDAIFRNGVLDAGVAFLHKPVTPRTLTQKVREVLDSPAS